MSDLTRTIPVSGRFTRRQKQLYNAVLRAFRQIRQSMVPGKTILDLRKEAELSLFDHVIRVISGASTALLRLGLREIPHAIPGWQCQCRMAIGE